jgi:hypothetical protein
MLEVARMILVSLSTGLAASRILQNQSISSPSRGNSHVVPNARNSSAQMSHCASSIQSFNGWDFGSSIVSCDVFLAGLASTVSHYRWVVVVREC